MTSATEADDDSSAAPSRSTVAALSHVDAPAIADSSFPRSFGDYTLLRLIAEGGFGQIYQAHHDRTFRLVAIKVLADHRRSDEASILRFQLEVQIGTELKHPHILPVIDHGTVDGQPYLAMPFIDGTDFLQIIAKQSIPAEEAVAVLRPVAEAVEHAHRAGYLHRDLKPANILIERGTGKPYVADFGLAKHTAAAIAISSARDVVGTQPYMPPEQIDPTLGDYSPATDVYALGVTLYQALTGHTPFPRKDRPYRGLRQQIAWDAPVLPSFLRPQVPRDLDRICSVCLQKSQFDRYASAAELANDLRRFQAGKPVEAKIPGAAKLLLRRCQRRPLLTGLLVAVIVVAAVAAVFAGSERSRADKTELRFRQAESRVEQTERRATQADVQAQESERAKRLREYDSALQQIERAWVQNETARVERLLSLQIPAPGKDDLRGIEWYYWDHRIRSEAIKVDTHRKWRALTISPDATKLAMTDYYTLSIWDVQSESILYERPIGNTESRFTDVFDFGGDDQSVAINSSGRFVAATGFTLDGHSRSGFVTVWRLEDGKEMFSVKADPDIGGRAVTFAPGDRLLVGGYGGAWLEWDLPTRQRRLRSEESIRPRSLEGGASPAAKLSALEAKFAAVQRIVFTDEDRTLVTACPALPPTFWSWPDGTRLHAPSDDALSLVGAIGASVGDNRAVVARLQSDAVVVTQSSQDGLVEERVGAQKATAFAVFDHGAAVATEDRSIHVWTLSNDAPPVPTGRALRGHTRAVRQIALSTHGYSVVSADEAGTVLIHRIGREPPLWQATPLEEDRYGDERAGLIAHFDQKRGVLVVERGPPRKLFVDRDQLRPTVAEVPLRKEPDNVWFAPSSSLLGVSSDVENDAASSKVLILWSLRKHVQAARIEPIANAYYGDVTFSDDGSMCAVPLAYTHKGIAVYDDSTGTVKTVAPDLSVRWARLSPTGRFVALAGLWGWGIFDLRQQSWTIRRPEVAAWFTFDQSESRAFIALPERVPLVVDLMTGQEVSPALSADVLDRAEFSPDGTRVYVPTRNGLEIVNSESWALLLTIPRDQMPVCGGTKADCLERALSAWKREHDESTGDKSRMP